MKVRLIGTPDEVHAALARLDAAGEVVEVSPSLPCRRPDLVRLYATLRPGSGDPSQEVAS